MKIQFQLFYLFITFISMNAFAQTGKQFLPGSSPSSSDIDFKEITVKDYVELLKIEKKEANLLYFLSTKEDAPADWITGSDIAYLISLANSQLPANCIVNVRSSHLPFKDSSTLGGQVMNLIDAYRFQKAYPGILYDCSKTDEARYRAIMSWWKKHSK